MWQAFLRYLQVDRTFLLLVFVFSYLLVISNRVRAGMMSWYVLTPEGPLASFAAAQANPVQISDLEANSASQSRETG